MITVNNYQPPANLPDYMRKGSEITQKALANDKKAYNSSDTIKKMVDAHIDELNNWLGAQKKPAPTKEPVSVPTKAAPKPKAAKPKAAPKANLKAGEIVYLLNDHGTWKKGDEAEVRDDVYPDDRTVSLRCCSGAMIKQVLTLPIDQVTKIQPIAKSQEPKAAPKPKATKPKAEPKATKPKTAKKTKPPKTRGEMQRSFREDLKIVKRFAAALDKPRSVDSLANLHGQMVKYIADGKIKKTNKYAELVEEISERLGKGIRKALDNGDNTIIITTSAAFAERIKEAAQANKVYTSVSLFKRFASMMGKQPKDVQVKALLTAIDNARHSGKILASDPFADEINQVHEVLIKWKPGSRMPLDVHVGLSGDCGLCCTLNYLGCACTDDVK
jgi:hypothetical protein